MSSNCSSDILGSVGKNNKLIIIVLIFVLFCCCGRGGNEGSCFPIDPCCRRRRRRPGVGGVGTLLPVLVILALVLGTGNKGGNTNIIKVNTDPSAVRGESTNYSYCDY